MDQQEENGCLGGNQSSIKSATNEPFSKESTLDKLEKIKAYAAEELGDWSGVHPEHLPDSLYSIGVILEMVEEAIECEKAG